MALNLRSLALAAAVCTTLPMAAQASAVFVDFESITVGANLVGLVDPSFSPQKLSFSAPSGTLEVFDIAGLQFIDPTFPVPPSGQRFAGAASFTLNIDVSGCTAGADPTSVVGCFNRVGLNVAPGRGSINVYDTTGAFVSQSLSGIPGGKLDSWNAIPVISTLGLINKIVFQAETGSAVFFDDLSMNYVGSVIAGPPTGPGGLPEPGGLALAGLALAGLAWTRRTTRSQQRG